MQLFQINQSEESSKITVNAHTTSCPLHQLSITTVSTLRIQHYLSVASSQLSLIFLCCRQIKRTRYWMLGIHLFSHYKAVFNLYYYIERRLNMYFYFIFLLKSNFRKILSFKLFIMTSKWEKREENTFSWNSLGLVLQHDSSFILRHLNTRYFYSKTSKKHFWKKYCLIKMSDWCFFEIFYLNI